MVVLNQSKCFQLLVLLLLSGAAFSEIVKTLPGFSGELPFKLETGYTSVGDIEFFYYFVESESNPAADPLLLYINGGPGCSSLNGFLLQIGPLKFNLTYISGLPSLLYQPNTWSKTANIIFLDAPVGTGFSYATTTEAWNTTGTETAEHVHIFLRNWLNEHPDFQTNPVYIGTDSYAGIISPVIALDIIEGNVAGLEPFVNLKGLSLGSPHTDVLLQMNLWVPYSHQLALISDEMYESAKKACNGTYVEVDETNTECVESMDRIDECLELIYYRNILEPYCAISSSSRERELVQIHLRGNTRNSLLQSPGNDVDLYCNTFPYLLLSIWGNYKTVQDALHVRPGTIKELSRCNKTNIAYKENIDSGIPYHKNLTNTGLQVLVFGGDHDLMIPHISVEQWIKSLDLTIDIDWRPWFVEGQVAGYTRRYTNNGYRLTYATVKGAGHSSPEAKPKECYNMFHRWINYYPL